MAKKNKFKLKQSDFNEINGLLNNNISIQTIWGRTKLYTVWGRTTLYTVWGRTTLYTVNRTDTFKDYNKAQAIKRKSTDDASYTITINYHAHGSVISTPINVNAIDITLIARILGVSLSELRGNI